MAMQRWKLFRFKECLARWVEMSFPPDETVRQVTNWITERLPVNPFPEGSMRFNEDPSMRYVQLPYKSTDERLVLVAWKVDPELRQLTCVILEEISDRRRP